MITSQEAFLLKLKEGIIDELYSALCFEALTKILPEDFSASFLTYAEEERAHAETLKNIYQDLTGTLPQITLPELAEIDDVLLFLIRYKSEEEAAIFLYESLYTFSKDENEKRIFKRIKEEEENHLKMVSAIISAYKERSLA